MRCACGCGGVTPIARRNRRLLGHVKGEHTPYMAGHRAGVGVGFDIEDRGYITPCHIGRGAKLGAGYNRVTRDGEHVLAHVAAYEAKHGPVPEGKTLDHLCRQPPCRNPDHLEPVTHAENCRRGAATKLTMAEAREIKRGGERALSAAKRYGVSRSTVQAIRSGRLWADA